MKFGLNISFITQGREMAHEDDRLLQALHQLPCRDYRIPLSWRRLVHGDPDGVALNPERLALIKSRLALLPNDATLLAYITAPPERICADYYHDPAAFPQKVACFFENLAKAFPEIKLWEVGNEPNASDFYLSRYDAQHGHRPWSPSEYVSDFLVPGAQALRRTIPGVTICAAGLAEDGLLGHLNKPAALSNLLADTPTFKPLWSQIPHGRLYFIPNFLDEFLVAIRVAEDRAKSDGLPPIVDALALHPYPYFQIHDARTDKLSNRSIKLINHFASAVRASNLSHVEIWVTEVGARSLHVAAGNHHDEHHQADYLEELAESLKRDRSLARLYWYQFADDDRDMMEEKTFGLIDHNFNRKLSYHSFARVLRQNNEHAVGYLEENFQLCAQYRQGAFDRQIWRETASTPYAYAIASHSESGGSCAAIFPGRSPGDRWQAETRMSIGHRPSNAYTLDIDCRYPTSEGNIELTAQLECRESTQALLCLSLKKSDSGGVALRISINGDINTFADIEPDLSRYPFATAASLTGVSIRLDTSQASATLRFGSMHLTRTIERETSTDTDGAYLRLAFKTLKFAAPGYMVVDRIALHAADSSDFASLPARDLGVPAGELTLGSNSRSQISQEEWVLRMLKFSRAGFFLEVGGHDGIENSNSLLLETEFEWRGLIVEANPRWYVEVCRSRRCVALNYAIFSEPGKNLEFVDAGAVGGIVSHLQKDTHFGVRLRHLNEGKTITVPSERADVLLDRFNTGRIADYLSIDTEGSEAEVLRSIDFERTKICLLTIEHAGVEARREEIWQLLSPFGFERIRVWFEDWYWHPAHLADRLKLARQDVEQHIANVNAMIPHRRRDAVMALALDSARNGNTQDAIKYCHEGTKTFYPNNWHFHIKLADAYARANDREQALKCVQDALATHPRNIHLLRAAAKILTELDDLKALMAVLDILLASGVEPWSTAADQPASETAIANAMRSEAGSVEQYRHLAARLKDRL